MRQGLLAITTAAAVLLAAGGAFAHHKEGHNPPGQGGPHPQADHHNTTVTVNNGSQNTNENNNTNTNTNTNNSSAVSTSSANAQSTSTATSNATGGNSTAQGGNASTSTSVSIAGDDNPASSAAPVYLTSSNDTCMGSTGIGGQGMTFGFSVGTTWTDKNCVMLKNSREMKNQGHDKAAMARLCMDDDNAIAFELAGTPCPRKLKSTQNAVATIKGWKEESNKGGKIGDRTALLPVGGETSAE